MEDRAAVFGDEDFAEEGSGFAGFRLGGDGEGEGDFLLVFGEGDGR